MADVFLSYKREDARRIRKLVSALREHDLDVWWDEDIPPSAPWEATIERALADAGAVIVCWSPASVASENVRSEARVARDDGRLIQVLLKPCQPPLFFGERQAVDLDKWRGNADDPRIARLAETVRKVAAGERVGAAGDSRRLSKWRSRNVAIAAIALLLGVGALTAYLFSALSARETQVAVLPFEDLSPGRDKAYFAEGVSEEILSALSTDRSIRVLGRTSARQIKPDTDPKSVRKTLGVTHLLEGSARTAGEALRVNVRLIDTKDGSTIWQEEYDGRTSDVFAVQDRISSAVVQNLRGIFARPRAPAERPVTKINAYETYLAARAIMRKRSEPSLRQALALARQVIATDRNYAPGQALYAELVWLLSDDPDAYGSIPAATATRISQHHARAAIRLAPNQAEGYAALGLAADHATAVPALKRAIALDPSRADVRIWLAIRFTKAAHYDEALQLARDAAAIEPLWPLPISDVIVRLGVSGQQAEARQMAEQYRARGGDQAQYHRLLFETVWRGADLSAAIAEGRQAFRLDPSLPPIDSVTLLELHSLVGMADRSPSNLPPSFVRLARPFYNGDRTALDAQIRSGETNLWTYPDGEIGFFHLAAERDWAALNRLYDRRPVPPLQLCFDYLEAAQAIAPALRAAGRQREAQGLLGCLNRRLTIEARQKSRSWYAYAGDFEYDRATVAALNGNEKAALGWLKQAVASGWLGRPYSPVIAHRPQFAFLAGNPQFAALQTQINHRIAQERREAFAIFRRRSN